MISIWVAAPSLAVRIGLKALLQEDENLEVIGDSASLAELINAPMEAEVLVIAGGLAQSGDLRLEKLTERSQPALLLLSDQPQAGSALTRLPWRAWGMLSPDAEARELAAAAHALHEGLMVGDPALLKQALEPAVAPNKEQAEPAEALTPREEEILQLLAQGLANKQIGHALRISEHTVKFHVSAVFAKLGVTNRTEAVRAGIQRGLVTV